MRAVWRVLAIGLTGLCSVMADTPVDRLPPEVRAAAERALAGGAVRLRSGALEDGRLTLDFSREVLALGLGSREFEQWSRAVHRAVAEPLRERLERLEVFTTIEGVPLHELLPAPATAPERAAAAAGAGPAEPGRAGLARRRIAVSPGHGYYLSGSNYVLQRAYWQGIVEDFVNHDIVTLLAEQLTAAGADVRPTRNLDRSAGIGETGFPKWQEAARYHVKALGVDPSVWNEAGFTHLEQDIRCRPRYANAINADVLVSIHNNGAGTPGAGTGTETLYDTNNGFGPESRRLADILHARVIAAIRRDYNPTWVDRRVQGFNGNYGENRLATRPAVLLEIAFMDRPTPDNAALQDERFKRLVATAIREGLEEFLEGAAAPLAPTELVAGGVAGGVVLGWRDRSDNEAGFRIERRAAADAAWTLVATVPANTVSYKDATAAAGAAQVYRVTAVNARGASGASNEVTGTAEPAGASPTAWLANVSLRTTLGAGQTVIVGLVMAGGGKDVLVRAAGPALRQFGVETVLSEPRMELFRGVERVASNAGWEPAGAATMARVGAFPFPAGSADAALVRAIDGAHSVQVAGATGGAVLVEAYDAGSGSGQRLVNLSARNRVGTGADVLIAGITVGGRGAQRLLVRAVGPGLTAFGVGGVLTDPRLELFDARGVKVTENDNWDVALAPVFAGLGAFALTPGSRDAAVVVTLPVGGYTAQVSGVANGTGEGLVEVYELP